MKSLSTTLKNITALSLIVVAAIFASIKFLDRATAVKITQILRSSPELHRASDAIPDLLLLLVCAGTAIMWTAYFSLTRRRGEYELTKFLRLAATALPVSYLLKTVLQVSFGRITTRAWVHTFGPMEFHWFHGTGEYGGFPSGHMTVFTSFFVAVGYCYPHYRLHSFSFLIILATALIVTDYHFLSDVIAGAYTGFLVTFATRRYIEGS